MTSERSKRRDFLSLIFISKSISKKLLIKILYNYYYYYYLDQNTSLKSYKKLHTKLSKISMKRKRQYQYKFPAKYLRNSNSKKSHSVIKQIKSIIIIIIIIVIIFTIYASFLMWLSKFW